MSMRRRRSATRTRDAGVAASYSSPACYLHEFEDRPGRSRSPRAASPHARGVALKRVYDEPESADGYRVLVDRLWPRGITRQRAALAEWLRDIAPSTALRQWFHRDPRRWSEFARRYRNELRAHPAELERLRKRAQQQRVTLLTAARDMRANHAVVLGELLSRSPRSRRSQGSRR